MTPKWAQHLGPDWRQRIRIMLRGRSRGSVAAELGISRDTLRRHIGGSRVYHRGMTASQWARHLGVPLTTFERHIKRHGLQGAIEKHSDKHSAARLPGDGSGLF